MWWPGRVPEMPRGHHVAIQADRASGEWLIGVGPGQPFLGGGANRYPPPESFAWYIAVSARPRISSGDIVLSKLVMPILTPTPRTFFGGADSSTGDCLHHSGPDSASLRFSATRQQHRELVSADPGKDNADSSDGAKLTGDRDQDVVTRFMSVLVVDAFESIQIHEEEGAETGFVGQLLPEPPVEVAAVEQVREGIFVDEVEQFQLEAFPLADVTRDRGNELRRAVRVVREDDLRHGDRCVLRW